MGITGQSGPQAAHSLVGRQPTSVENFNIRCQVPQVREQAQEPRRPRSQWLSQQQRGGDREGSHRAWIRSEETRRALQHGHSESGS